LLYYVNNLTIKSNLVVRPVAFVLSETICTKPGHFCVLNAAFGTLGQTATNRDCPRKKRDGWSNGHLGFTL